MDKLTVKFAYAYCRLESIYGSSDIAKKAAIESGVPEPLAGDWSAERLSCEEVQAFIRKRRRELANAEKISKESVLSEWYEVANADPNEAINIKRVNCRYCHGMDGKYQWTQQEFNTKCDNALAMQKPMPDMAGGFGFNPWREPNELCSECGGLGVERVFVESLENLKPNVRKAIASVEMKADGSVKITFRDKDKAFDAMAKHLGMLVDRKEISGSLDVNKTVSAADLSDDELAAIANGSPE